MGRFVGRHREFDVLADALGQAVAGNPRLVMVGGEAGVGKTRLVERLASAAAADGGGALVLTTACVEHGLEGLPLAPIVTALRGLVRQIGVDRLVSLFPEPAELARLPPELGLPAGPAVQGDPAGHARLFQQLTVVMEGLGADRTVLLLVEDLHWADRSTREFLDILARNLRDARVLVVVTYRTDVLPRGHPLRPFIAELRRLGVVRHLDLERFTRAETAELAESALGEHPPEALVDRVFGRSGGNAFFVEELVKAELNGTAAGLDDSLCYILLSQIERLPEVAQRVIRVVAIERERVSHQLLAAVAELPEEALLGAARGH